MLVYAFKKKLFIFKVFLFIFLWYLTPLHWFLLWCLLFLLLHFVLASNIARYVYESRWWLQMPLMLALTATSFSPSTALIFFFCKGL